MKGFGVHTSMWTMRWDADGAARAIEAAKASGMDFIEIALLDPEGTDADLGRQTMLRTHLRPLRLLPKAMGWDLGSSPSIATKAT